MTSRILDVYRERELKIDAGARPGFVFLIGKGFILEFTLEELLAGLGREFTSDSALRLPMVKVE